MRKQYESQIKEIKNENTILKSTDPLNGYNRVIMDQKQIINKQKIQIMNLKQHVFELEAETSSYYTETSSATVSEKQLAP